ncbi:1,6-anhydro-N-acetylmuramyl-L-alanine amidase AmpD [Colwellia sp. 4_MG-2023]|uniref:1,6-anhydro-N-acetylmuramyl-L-alanine amidase AmpD n=1 Tax=unclassified Colwellia TaxID=196834 RepID=UPI001C07F052|nr:MULTISPECIES: 1,6-anhydro-N-acetylmuramyl-L-alanine amidase AmpD [unclassified Colwellia]MBU2925391.1 1,6-anhydro-N-acetylmuramyl-L-alanine amidase AmpD [Colwellia sp. C2M11]MDO6506026.1 1,6-anhydro-N-acetylmuramyl-L-alanine amidase AmpD [Colwellia sp. 5_MG-2023]MDO6554914.1 1,6-anhydro-N-acetylmuramyl-L-alanine amidase AmpD [Colwellia sp. 4_MG-2023]MDO6653479.1 1,6-anhydro-N-acetylmuramyl-L-alanine amidase AmpD [Colwellia sp. 3_MG-2023]MDO6666263.1 1,6-anhydro-N-acetylmuramyl-L-alanine ami
MSLSKQKKVIKRNNLQPNYTIENGWLSEQSQQRSPFFTPRCQSVPVSLLVVHNISLPAGEFGNNYITDLFLGRIDANAHPSFADIAELQVSAHCLIKRDGSIIQYVSFNDKAWHAGVSNFNGIEKCNDFSIGIELEGTDDIPYEEAQYQALAALTAMIQKNYPLVSNENITGHCDIAKGRKTDPGPAFNWPYFHQCLQSNKVNE